MEKPKLWLLEEVAKRIRVHPKTLAKYCQRGLLPHIKTPGGHYRIKDEIARELIDGGAEALEALQKKAEARGQHLDSDESAGTTT